MRIALIHYSFWPIVGGVERVIEQHALLFAQAGHEVTVLCGRGSVPPSFHAWSEGQLLSTIGLPAHSTSASPGRLTLEVHPLLDSQPSFETMSGEGNTEDLRHLLLERCARHEIVILHNVCTMPFNLPLTAALWEVASALPHRRFISWVHDLAAINPDYRISQTDDGPWRLLREAYDHFEYVAVSEIRRGQICNLTGLNSERCCVIPNGIDAVGGLLSTSAVSKLACTFGLLERDVVLLHPTCLLRRKNVEQSIRVTAALRDAGQDAVLLITGAADPHNAASSGYAAELRALQRELDLEDCVLFLNDTLDVSDSQLADLFRLADALIFPSRQEGFGLPLLEAAVHRLPIFCADMEPMSSLFPQGVSRFSLEVEPAQIARQIMQQLGESPAIQTRKAAVRNFAWPTIYWNHLAPLLEAPNITATV